MIGESHQQPTYCDNTSMSRHQHHDAESDPSGSSSKLEDEEDEEQLLPPENFAMIERGLYRSSFPMRKHFPFLRKIGIRSVMTFVLEEYPQANLEFMEANNVRLITCGFEGNKEPFKYMPDADIREALQEMLNPANHPMLIHCNAGKHRTGTLVGCLRRVQRWSLSSIFDEYIRFAHPKPRMVDQQKIELFDPTGIRDYFNQRRIVHTNRSQIQNVVGRG